jgi:bacterioferritin
MEKQELIAMLNKDMAEEHAAILRYLVHSYLEGEDTPLGASLLSRAREEMWHMHWLGMIVGRHGGEPNLTPAPYPYDPTNRATIFKSYVDYELKLVPHYHGEADKVDDPHIKRVLHREAWESEYHARKFQRILDKMTPEQAEGIRSSWVFQQESIVGWQLMDFSMTKMKQLAHLAEEVAENGITPRFEAGKIDLSASVGAALKKGFEDVRVAREEHIKFQGESETQKHAGLLLSLDLTLKQEEYEAAEIEDWSKKS